MSSITELTDEQLLAMSGEPQVATQQPRPDLSLLSNEELLALDSKNKAIAVGYNVSTEPNDLPGASYINKQGKSEVNAEPVPPKSAMELWKEEQLASGKISPTEPSLWQKLKGEMPETGGGIAGAWAGAKLGGELGGRSAGLDPRFKAAGTTIGAIGGSMLGGMGGKAGQQLYQRATGGTPKTSEELWKEELNAGYQQGAGEVTGRGIISIAGKALAPFAKSLRPRAVELASKLKQFGASLSPAQMTTSRTVDTLENIAEHALLTTDDLQQLKTAAQPLAYKKYIESVAERIGGGKRWLDSTTTGNLVLDTIEGSKALFKQADEAHYLKLDKLSQKVKGFAKTVEPTEKLPKGAQQVEVFAVDMTPVTKRAKQLIKEQEPFAELGDSKAIASLANKVSNLKDAGSFMQAHAIRSNLLQDVRDIEAAMLAGRKSPKLNAAAQELANIVDGQMEKAAISGGEDVVTAWRAADTFHKEGAELFNKGILKQLTKSLEDNPQNAVNMIFKPDNLTSIKTVMGIADNKTKTALKSAYLEKLLNQYADTDKTLLGKSFLEGTTGDKGTSAVMSEVFSKTELKEIEGLGLLGKMMQSNTGGGGGMLIQLTQPGAVIQLVGGIGGGATGHYGTAATLVAAPPVLSKMMTSDFGRKWLTEGLKLPAKSPEAATVASKLTMAVYMAELQQEREEQTKRIKEYQETKKNLEQQYKAKGPFAP